MTSYREFPKSAPSSPTYELRRAHGQALVPSHHGPSDRLQLSARPRSLAEPIHVGGGLGYNHLAGIPHGAERIREADARLRRQVPRSRGLHQQSNLDLCSYTSQPSLPMAESEYELYPTSPRKRRRVSLENTFDSLHGNSQPSQLVSDRGLAHAGSWCHSTPIDPKEMELDIYGCERDVLSEDWRPKTPFDTRLSTPDLPPLSTDFEFCPCHLPGEHEHDRINEDFYFATRSKMDMQSMLIQSSLILTT